MVTAAPIYQADGSYLLTVSDCNQLVGATFTTTEPIPTPCTIWINNGNGFSFEKELQPYVWMIVRPEALPTNTIRIRFYYRDWHDVVPGPVPELIALPQRGARIVFYNGPGITPTATPPAEWSLQLPGTKARQRGCQLL